MFFRSAQLEMLEHLAESQGSPTADTVARYCRTRQWQQHTQNWIDWLGTLVDNECQLTPEGRSLLAALSAGAYTHDDPRAEALVLRAANGGVDDDSVAGAVNAICRDTPIRHYERLLYRLINDQLVDGSPTNRAHQGRHFPPTVQAITTRGVDRLGDLEARRGDPRLVFYSWQSDDQVRTRLIRGRLQQACEELDLGYDEATRDNAGSPEIHTTIRAKIARCGIFVADINIVSGITGDGERPTPNPNVMYELGLADSRLPAGRVLLLFDGDRGQLPFDVRQRRVSSARDQLIEFLRRSVAVQL